MLIYIKNINLFVKVDVTNEYGRDILDENEAPASHVENITYVGATTEQVRELVESLDVCLQVRLSISIYLKTFK